MARTLDGVCEPAAAYFLLDPNGDTIFYTLMGNDESEFGASVEIQNTSTTYR